MTAIRSELTVAERVGGGVRHRQPHGSLLTYYVLCSLLFGPLFPFAFLYHYFRYRTLRYEIDDQGITMRWGVLFRREISLTYARIQDIHLTSNVVERWLGLARIQIQTASGSSSAEMTIEGLKDFEAIRDDLYSRMRGARTGTATPGPVTAARAVPRERASGGPAADELAAALQETAAELRRLRESLEARRVAAGGEADHV